MQPHDPLKTEEAKGASWEAGKGGLIGAAKWGAGAAVLGVVGHLSYPVYRSTTIQFKVYIQMSAMILGGMIDADWRLRRYEERMRLQRKWLTERAKWESYQNSIQEEFSSPKNNK